MTRLAARTFFVLYALWGIILPARADDFSGVCFDGFAMVSGEDPATLVEKTYGDLLSTLGGALSVDIVKKVRAGGDPYQMPNEPGIASLRRRLLDFQKLVRERGWDTPEIRQRLLTSLDARAKGMEKAGEAIVRADASLVDRVIAMKSGQWTTESPDGRYFVSTNALTLDGTGRKFSLNVYDRTTGKTEEYPTQLEHAHPFFTRGGKNLVMGNDWDQFLMIPFENGVPHWGRVRMLGMRSGSPDWSNIVQVGADPTVFYGGPEIIHISRYDLTTGRSTPLNYEEYSETGSLKDWKVIPGTDHHLVLFRALDGGTFLDVVEVNADGTLKKLWQQGRWKGPGSAFTGAAMASNTKTALLWNSNRPGLWSVDAPGAEPRQIGDNMFVNKVAVNETTGEMAVLANVSMSKWVEVYKGNPLKSVGKMMLPEGEYQSIEFSRDGDYIRVGQQREIREIPFRAKTGG